MGGGGLPPPGRTGKKIRRCGEALRVGWRGWIQWWWGGGLLDGRGSGEKWMGLVAAALARAKVSHILLN